MPEGTVSPYAMPLLAMLSIGVTLVLFLVGLLLRKGDRNYEAMGGKLDRTAESVTQLQVGMAEVKGINNRVTALEAWKQLEQDRTIKELRDQIRADRGGAA